MFFPIDTTIATQAWYQTTILFTKVINHYYSNQRVNDKIIASLHGTSGKVLALGRCWLVFRASLLGTHPNFATGGGIRIAEYLL